MQSSSHFISSFDVTFELVVSGSPEFHAALQHHSFWFEFVPGFRYAKVTNPVSKWLVTESDMLDYDVEQRAIRSPVEGIRRCIVVIEAEFEYQRQLRSLYTLHGSVIERAGQAVAFIGNVSGIGKTSLASYASQHGWNWLGDEKFTLSGNTVVGGTASVLDDPKTHLAAGGHSPGGFSETSYPLALVCQVIVTSEEKLTKFTLTPDKSLWFYNDEVTRDIRQVNGIVSAALPVLQSFDNSELAKARHTAVQELVHTTPLLYLRGSALEILGAIEAELA